MFSSPSWFFRCLSWLFSPANHYQVPPALANMSCVPVECSCVRSHVNRSCVCLQAPVDRPRVHSQVLVDCCDASSNRYNPDEADEDNNASNNGKTRLHAARNSKSHGEAKPFHLGYYVGTWVDVLVTSPNNYRKYIHTKSPFLDCNSESLNEVHNILLEAIPEFRNDGRELDDSK